MRFFYTRTIVTAVFSFFIFPLSAQPSMAQEFGTTYNVTYTISPETSQTEIETHYAIGIDPETQDREANSFLLSLPGNFIPSSITASVNRKSVNPLISNEQNLVNIIVPFDESLENTQTIDIRFRQRNSLIRAGNTTELLLPTLLSSKSVRYSITVLLPDSLKNSVSMSKPMFTERKENALIWENPSGNTIQILFGNEQYYDAKLMYELANNSLFTSYADIPIPPDTLYQRSYIENFSHKPVRLFLDEDGNLLARYYLTPGEKKRVEYSGSILLSLKPQDAVAKYQEGKLIRQQYLLQPFKESLSSTQKFSTARNVYNHVKNTLRYDYSQLQQQNPRSTAKSIKEIISNPNKSICLDYSAYFVSLSRENGLHAREVIGYGHSHQESLRPVSGDLLHSWAEYFDVKKKRWMSVDPTWEDTSLIDYFSEFDLNHIALAIHGKDSQKPLPPGFYRFQDSKTESLVSIKLTDKKPELNESHTLTYRNSKVDAQNSNRVKLQYEVANTGKVIQYNLPVSGSFESQKLQADPAIINAIPPYEKVIITILAPVHAKDVIVRVGDEELNHNPSRIPKGYNIAFSTAFTLLIAFFAMLGIFSVIKKLRRR